MIDLSGFDIEVRILLAIAGLTLEKAGREKITDERFTAEQIHQWFVRNPKFGNPVKRVIQRELNKMRKKEKEIHDDNGISLGHVKVLAWTEKKQQTFFYKIPGNAAETPLSAALIVKLDKLRRLKGAIHQEDEAVVVDELFEQFKNDPVYDLKDKTDVSEKVKEAERGWYFTRDTDGMLRRTTRIFLEEDFLNLLSTIFTPDNSGNQAQQ